MMNDDLFKISLNQGKQFNMYQSKIKKHVTKVNTNRKRNNREGFVSLEQEQMVRPSFDGYVPVLQNMQSSSSLSNSANQKDLDDLKQLKSQYNNLIQQYTDIQKKIGSSSLDTINRLGSNNPYLNKTIRFTTGEICYVTNQGVVKWFPSPEIWHSVNMPKDVINVNIPWDPAYNIPGTTIPTNPPLISGTNVQKGQSLGNEGNNVYASLLTNNPESSYIGCYNDKPNSTNINIVPIMNSSNSVNGFQSGASSTFMNNNEFAGPWAAFDQNPNTFWASDVTSNYIYNASTGIYEGSTMVSVANVGNIGGEFLKIDIPGVDSNSTSGYNVNQYSLSPRLDLITTRSPNSWYVLGYRDSQWYQVDRQQNQTFNSGNPKVYNVSSPGIYTSYLLLIDKVGNEDQSTERYCVQVAEWNLYSNSDANFTDDQRAMIYNPSLINYTTFEKCQEYASKNGFKYFGMQNYQADGTAACLVSNDNTRIQSYGDANTQSSAIPIWSSETSGNQGAYASLTSEGNLIVYGSSGNILYTSPNAPADCKQYYTVTNNADSYGNDITSVQNSTAESCQLLCNNNDNCAGIVFAKSGTYANMCFIKNLMVPATPNNDLDFYTRNPTPQARQSCKFYLILQGDGNMCIYRGNDPFDNKGGIWCTMTNGQQKNTNKDWISSSGKFGTEYMKSGTSLMSNEWIGSVDGSLKLIMQSDGNLVLYTSETTSGCKVINDKTYGGPWVNAVYQLSAGGNRATLGKIGYIDAESNLREYPDSMIGFTNDYQIYQNTDSYGNDMTSLITPDINGCQSACNSNPNCAAFVYQGSSQTCFLKNSSAFPKSEKQTVNNLVLGVRQPGLKGSTTCSNTITNIDTIQFDNYLKGSAMTPETQCNTSLVSKDDQMKFDNIKSQLVTLGNEITSKMERLYNQDKTIFQKLNTNAEQFKKDLENYKLTNLKIMNELNLHSNNIEGMQNLNINDLNGMLSDSDLRVLQGNYSYIMWSILAVGILTITINSMKK